MIVDISVYKRDEVVIEERFDDTLHIRLKDTYLKYHTLPERPKKISVPVVALTSKVPVWRPKANHPWKKSLKKI